MFFVIVFNTRGLSCHFDDLKINQYSGRDANLCKGIHKSNVRVLLKLISNNQNVNVCTQNGIVFQLNDSARIVHPTFEHLSNQIEFKRTVSCLLLKMNGQNSNLSNNSIFLQNESFSSFVSENLFRFWPLPSIFWNDNNKYSKNINK